MLHQSFLLITHVSAVGALNSNDKESVLSVKWLVATEYNGEKSSFLTSNKILITNAFTGPLPTVTGIGDVLDWKLFDLGTHRKRKRTCESYKSNECCLFGWSNFNKSSISAKTIRCISRGFKFFGKLWVTCACSRNNDILKQTGCCLYDCWCVWKSQLSNVQLGYELGYCVQFAQPDVQLPEWDDGAKTDGAAEASTWFISKARSGYEWVSNKENKKWNRRIINICFYSSMGYSGRECVLRALCESSQYFRKKGSNMVAEMLRTLFSYPKSKVLSFEHSDHRIYDEAHRKGRNKVLCQSLYPTCGFSLLELALGKYSSPFSSFM